MDSVSSGEGITRLRNGRVLRCRVVQFFAADGSALTQPELEFRVNYRPVGLKTGARLFAAAASVARVECASHSPEAPRWATVERCSPHQGAECVQSSSSRTCLVASPPITRRSSDPESRADEQSPGHEGAPT